MTDAQFTTIVNSIRNDIAKRTPYDTGNLATNATRIESLGVNEMRVFIDTNIAPYFRYVNFAERLVNNADNPNRGYWERAIKGAVEKIAQINGAEVESV